MSPARAESGRTVHATAIVLGEAGILIRGEPGSGKTALARELIGRQHAAGGFARLVCDDRVLLERAGGRLVARAVAPIAGLVEIRGVGIVAAPHMEAAVIRLVVDVDPRPVRLPEGEPSVELCGVELPRIAVNGPLSACVVEWAMRGNDVTAVTVR